MQNNRDNPGVYIPPPLIYVLIFFVAVLIQKKAPLDDSFFDKSFAKIIGICLFIVASFFLFRSLRQFFQSKNTLITVKPAASLQTTGVYAITRNPMYLGLAIVYLGISCLVGSWWNFILFPLLLFIVQSYIIKREEKYLLYRFGQPYLDYKLTTRRWL